MSFAFEREPYLQELQIEVVGTGTEGDRPFALLSDTLLYPEGGGQPSDRGFLGDVPVLDVKKSGGEVRHYLERAVAPGPALLRLDWTRRFDHMQQHTGQHLLTAVAADRFGWETLAFHLGAEVSTIEIGAPRPERDALDALEEAVAAEVRAARAVRARRVAPEELAKLATLPVRTRGLPEGHEGEVRLVEIEGVDLNTCGGTHVASTAEIEVVKVTAAEAHGKTSLLSFVCGGRARRRFGLTEGTLADLRALLQAPDAELAAAARAKLEQLRAAEKRARDAAKELAEAQAAELAAREARVVDAHLPGRDLPHLQEVARLAAARAPEKLLLLTGGAPGAPLFVVALGEAVPVDLAPLGRAVAEALGGRGGGSGRLFQGCAAGLLARDAALALLSRAAGSAEGKER